MIAPCESLNFPVPCIAIRGGAASRKLTESGLREMFVERQGIRDATPIHQDEGDAVGQRIGLVLMLLKELPALVEKRLVHVDELDGGASEQAVAQLDGLRVAFPA